ncbi:MAG TPA: monovalent cation/H+ antiporter complex subunit F [Nitrospiria bacterium]|jgi:multicomponent Na+:H+ antiporter subunit F
MMFQVAAVFVVIAILVVLYRALSGPTVFDRILSTNLIGTKTVVLLALIGFIYDRPQFLDIALVYAIINFIATVAILKYIQSGNLD